MVQWRNDNFEWKKLDFHSKHNTVTLFQKNAHNTRHTFLCNVVAHSSCNSVWLRLQLSHGPTRKQNGSWKSACILHASGRASCFATPMYLFLLIYYLYIIHAYRRKNKVKKIRHKLWKMIKTFFYKYFVLYKEDLRKQVIIIKYLLHNRYNRLYF